MTELVLVTADGAVAIALSEPEQSVALADALYVMSCGCDDATKQRHATAAVREEAGCILAWIAPRTAPAPVEWIHAWLGRLNLALTFVLPEAELKLRAPAVVDALATLPKAVFTADSLRRAKLEFRGFPGAKDAYEFLRPAVASLLGRQRALRRLVDFKLQHVSSDKPATQSERESIVANFREKMRGARAPERSASDQMAALGASPSARPAHLTPDQIRAARAGAKAGDVISAKRG